MLRSALKLLGYKIKATDYKIGNVHDFYFDDQIWAVRYLIADTGNWLPGKQVLLSPDSLEIPDRENKIFPVKLTKEQVENSPDISNDQPVSRQHEIELSKYYGWPSYWIGPGAYMPSGSIVPPPINPYNSEKVHQEKNKNNGDLHLRSIREVTGYSIETDDVRFGHVEDFLIEDDTWLVRYLIIDTQNWLPGSKKVVVALHWIKSIDWDNSKVHVELEKGKIENSPEFDYSQPLDRDFEKKLHKFYDKPKYWE